jgi:hypothetical protein
MKLMSLPMRYEIASRIVDPESIEAVPQAVNGLMGFVECEVD